MLKLCCWNAKSVEKKAVMLENLVVDHCPDVMLITETWINGHDHSKWWPNGYDAIANGRESRGGGVAWIVRRGVKVMDQIISEHGNGIEWVAIKVEVSKHGQIWFVGCYVLKGEVRWSSDFLEQFLGENVIMCGDLNAKGPNLPYVRDFNSSGREVSKILTHKWLNLNGPFVPTHKLGGTLDLILSNQPIFHSVGAITVGDYYDSDHKVVSTTIESPRTPTEMRYDYTRARWSLFEERMKARLKKIEWPDEATPEGIERLSQYIVKSMNDVAESTIPKIPVDRVRTWRSGKQIAESIQLRHHYQRLKESTGLPIFGLLANSAYESYKLSVKKAESKAQHDQLVALEKARKCNTKQFFNIVDRLAEEGIRNSKGVRTLIVEGKSSKSEVDKAEVLKKHLESQFSMQHVETSDPEVEEKRLQVEKFVIDHHDELVPLQSAPCVGSVSVSKTEIRDAIRRLKLKAPGFDNVSNILIKKGGRTLENALRRLYNMSLSSGFVPPSWKLAVVVPLPRPGKDLSSPKGYRPVSLLPVIGKLLEAMLAARLASDFTKHRVLPRCQSAFRIGHSTTDQTFKLAQLAHLARAKKEVMVTAFIDFEGAFNAVWHHGLRYKISNCPAITGQLTRWLSSFLGGRSFIVRVGESCSDQAVIAAGVPQGSALSPILFNLFTSDLPVDKDGLGVADSLVYADDVTATAVTCWPGLAAARVQKKVRQFQRWSECWRMPINPSKCQVLVIGNCRSDIKVFLKGRPIPRVNEVKYLGVTFDHKLTFGKHFDEIVAKANSRIAVLKKLCFSRQITTETKLLLFKATIRPILEYSCTAFIAAPDEQLKKIQVVQNKCLRMCLSLTLLDKVKTETIHERAGIPTIEKRFIHLSGKFGNRALNQVAPISSLIQEQRSNADVMKTPLGKFRHMISAGPAIEP